MTSVTTAVATGFLLNWCVLPLHTTVGEQTIRSECANETLHTRPEDFQTVCCSGVILYGSSDTGPRAGLFGPYVVPAVGSHAPPNYWGWGFASVYMDNLTCYDLSVPSSLGDGRRARLYEDQPDSDGDVSKRGTGYSCVAPLTQPSLMHSSTSLAPCIPGSEAPLASHAGTNTNNAASNYRATYTLPADGGTATGGVITATTTAVPTCLWVETVGGQHLVIVTATAPAPVSGSGDGDGDVASGQITGSESVVGAPTATSTSFAVSSRGRLLVGDLAVVMGSLYSMILMFL